MSRRILELMYTHAGSASLGEGAECWVSDPRHRRRALAPSTEPRRGADDDVNRHARSSCCAPDFKTKSHPAPEPTTGAWDKREVEIAVGGTAVGLATAPLAATASPGWAIKQGLLGPPARVRGAPSRAQSERQIATPATRALLLRDADRASRSRRRTLRGTGPRSGLVRRGVTRVRDGVSIALAEFRSAKRRHSGASALVVRRSHRSSPIPTTSARPSSRRTG